MFRWLMQGGRIVGPELVNEVIEPPSNDMWLLLKASAPRPLRGRLRMQLEAVSQFMK
jgi:hypothetical protein